MKKRDDSDILDMRSPAEDINAAPKRRMSREAAALGMSKKQTLFSAIASGCSEIMGNLAASVTVDVEGTVSIEMGEEKLSEKSASSSLAPGMSKARM